MTSVSPFCRGEVSMHERDSPLLRPTVVSSSTGMPAALQPSLPKLIVSVARCTKFMVFRTRSLGMSSTLRHWWNLEFPMVRAVLPGVGMPTDDSP